MRGIVLVTNQVPTADPNGFYEELECESNVTYQIVPNLQMINTNMKPTQMSAAEAEPISIPPSTS